VGKEKWKMEKRDTEKYLKLSASHEPDEANKSIELFFTELGMLREKYGFPDVIAIISLNIKYDSSTGEAITWQQYGDSTKTEMLLAYALGQVQKERRELINRLMSGTKKDAS
jgi:hypothetical protein